MPASVPTRTSSGPPGPLQSKPDPKRAENSAVFVSIATEAKQPCTGMQVAHIISGHR